MNRLILNGRLLAICYWLCAAAAPCGRSQSFVQTLAFKGAAALQGIPAAPFSKTNIASVTNLSYWLADGQTFTNAAGKLSNWVDRGVSPNNLTNLASSTLWPSWSNNIVNGHAAVRFPAAFAYLQSVNYTSQQPHTVVMVVRWWSGTLGNTGYYYDSTDSTKRNYFRMASANVQIGSASSATVGTSTTNKWQVIEVVHNGTSATYYSNNVCAGTFSSGTSVAQGFVLGNNNVGNSPAYIDVAEVRTYFGTFGAVDSAGTFSLVPDRYASYNDATNTYGISQ